MNRFISLSFRDCSSSRSSSSSFSHHKKNNNTKRKNNNTKIPFLVAFAALLSFSFIVPCCESLTIVRTTPASFPLLAPRILLPVDASPRLEHCLSSSSLSRRMISPGCSRSVSFTRKFCCSQHQRRLVTLLAAHDDKNGGMCRKKGSIMQQQQRYNRLLSPPMMTKMSLLFSRRNSNGQQRRRQSSSLSLISGYRNYHQCSTKRYYSYENESHSDDLNASKDDNRKEKEEEVGGEEEAIPSTSSLKLLDNIQKSMCNDILLAILSRGKDAHHGHNQDDVSLSSFLNIENNNNGLPPSPWIIILGVSGGCDSIALFHGMTNLLQRRNTSNDHPKSNNHDDDELWMLPLPPPLPATNKKRSNKQHDNNDHEDEKCYIPCILHVVHFDHEQRGVDSDNDRLFVEKLCEDANIPFHCYYWSDPPDSHNSEQSQQEKKGFSQEMARDWRRHTLMRLHHSLTTTYSPSSSTTTAATTTDANTRRRPQQPLPGVILSAHHADDSDETILLKLLRGVHISHFTGMEPVTFTKMNIPPQQLHACGNDNNNNTHQHDDDDGVDNDVVEIAFGKPMLNIRKDEIISYLKSQGYSWREDGSNKSNKYMRNRVRNQLIPLMEDLVGGKQVLQKRLHNLQEQSQSINDDLTTRSNAYLENGGLLTSNNNNNKPLFILPSFNNSTTQLSLVQQEAMYQWIIQRQKQYNNNENPNTIATPSNTLLSYEHLQRIYKQISNYPTRLQWSMDIGGGWTVIRNGNVLDIIAPTTTVIREEEGGEMTVGKSGCCDDDTIIQPVWSVVNDHDLNQEEKGDEEHNQPNYDDCSSSSNAIILEERNITLNLPIHTQKKLVMKTVKGNEKMMFLPSWRSGRSPIPIKKFLRGQKVPLHRRDLASILCIQQHDHDELEETHDDEKEKMVVAVFVENNNHDDNLEQQQNEGKWMVGAPFGVPCLADDEDTTIENDEDGGIRAKNIHQERNQNYDDDEEKEKDMNVVTIRVVRT